jgi:putative membrane protein
MLAWIRTGIALMAFGFAIARFAVFLRQVASVGQLAVRPQHGVGSAWVGAVLVALGMIANLLARSATRRSGARSTVAISAPPTPLWSMYSGLPPQSLAS